MTRKTFFLLGSSLVLATTLTSPAALAWFSVSLPGSAIAMSGSTYGPPITATAPGEVGETVKPVREPSHPRTASAARTESSSNKTADLARVQR